MKTVPLSLCAYAGLALSACTLPIVATAQGETMAVDLSHHRIAIHSSFTGAEVLLFGAVKGVRGGNIIAVLTGPNQPVVVRRKARTVGIWLNRAELLFESAPGYYAVAASSPIERILEAKQRESKHIGLKYIKLVPAEEPSGDSGFGEFRDALLRHKVNQGLYFADSSSVEFVGADLFRVRFSFPSNVPPGRYEATVYQVEDGQVVANGNTNLVIRKTGIEARIYRTAHDSPWLYGILAVVLALMAGWLASAIFRRT